MLDELIGSLIEGVCCTLLKLVVQQFFLLLCTPVVLVASLISHFRYGGKLSFYLEQHYFDFYYFFKKWA